MIEFSLLLDRATSQIDNILNAFAAIAYAIFKPYNNGFGKMLIDTIMGNEYFLIGISLLIIGFVIGIIKRVISL